MQDAAINNTSIESIQSQISHPIWPLRLMAHLPPEQEGNSGTMIVRHQLPGHVNTIDAICFNNNILCLILSIPIIFKISIVTIFIASI